MSWQSLSDAFCMRAGKSTLVNCLTGLLDPTHGNAWVFGHSIRNISRLQSRMGVCMQDDILFQDLTTREVSHNHSCCARIMLGREEW
jgi:ABC-type multidrug transport system ATPase subunit